MENNTQPVPDSNTPMAAPSRWAENEKPYIGTKVIRAMPMTEHSFLMQFKGKTIDEVRQQENRNGYKVTYEDNYISWSPKNIFVLCYREVSSKEFGLIQSW